MQLRKYNPKMGTKRSIASLKITINRLYAVVLAPGPDTRCHRRFDLADLTRLAPQGISGAESWASRLESDWNREPDHKQLAAKDGTHRNPQLLSSPSLVT